MGRPFEPGSALFLEHCWIHIRRRSEIETAPLYG